MAFLPLTKNGTVLSVDLATPGVRSHNTTEHQLDLVFVEGNWLVVNPEVLGENIAAVRHVVVPGIESVIDVDIRGFVVEQAEHGLQKFHLEVSAEQLERINATAPQVA